MIKLSANVYYSLDKITTGGYAEDVPKRDLFYLVLASIDVTLLKLPPQHGSFAMQKDGI